MSATASNAVGAMGLGLTRREYQVLVLSADGDNKRQVGEVLGITEDTVRSYSKSLFLKLGARNMVHAVAIGFIQGILTI